jgi:DNA helicase HerA-like ATPase
VISELGVGEALVSTLQENGTPSPVQRTLIAPPHARVAAITPDERAAVRARSPIGTTYDVAVNRESAYGMLTKAAASAAAAEQEAEVPRGRARAAETPAAAASPINDLLFGNGRRQGMVEAMAKSAARSVGSSLGRQILRGILGGITGGTTRRRR